MTAAYLAIGEYVGPVRADTLVRYAMARRSVIYDELLYRHYATELVRLGHNGMTFSRGYLDYRSPRPTENRAAEDIIADVTARAGITLEGEDEPARPHGEDRR